MLFVGTATVNFKKQLSCAFHTSCPKHSSRKAHNRKGWIIDVSMLIDGAKIDIFDCIRVDFLPGGVL